MRKYKRNLFIVMLVYAGCVFASEDLKQTKTYIHGCIKTAEGSPVKGIEVRCMYIDPKYDYEFVWQEDSQLSDDLGKYTFHAIGNREYRINAGGKKSTTAQSKRFLAPSSKEIFVEDLIVVPATASLKGTIVNSDGSTAAGLPYSCQSENFQLFHPFDYPETEPNGGFHIPAVLSNEPLDFWVVPSPNNVQIWTGLIPDGKDLLFRLNPDKFLELPPDWKMYHYVEGLAIGMSRTRVEEDVGY